MYNLVEEENGCLIWGGGLDLSPADDIIIQVEHPLNLDSEGQMIASILSKKKSAGSDFVLIDIPIGKTAKVKKKSDAIRLKKVFEKVGKSIGIKIKVIITDGSQPIGNGVGALHEAKDIVDIFEDNGGYPNDLKEKSLIMAGIILEESGAAKRKEGYLMAQRILESGLANTKFKTIIKLQGENKEKLKPKYSLEIKVGGDVKVKEIDNKLISKLAFVLGAPKDKTAGMRLHKKVGDIVKKGEVVVTLYSNSNLRLKYAKNFFDDNEVYLFK